jgi:hypothetical protein
MGIAFAGRNLNGTPFFNGSSGFRVKKFSPERPSAAKPQPKIGISPAKAQRPQRN